MNIGAVMSLVVASVWLARQCRTHRRIAVWSGLLLALVLEYTFYSGWHGVDEGILFIMVTPMVGAMAGGLLRAKRPRSTKPVSEGAAAG